MIGAGAVVTRDVPSRAIVVGNPGVVTGYVDQVRDGGKGRLKVWRSPGRGKEPGRVEISRKQRRRGTGRASLRVLTASSSCRLAGGLRVIIPLPRISDPRGHLCFAAEINETLPFPVARYFLVFGVPKP